MTANRLTIAELSRLLMEAGMNRSAIQRYDENEPFRTMLGKDGDAYPDSALSYWKQIAEARKQDPPLVNPKTAHIFLEGLMQRGEPSVIEYRSSDAEPSPHISESVEVAPVRPPNVDHEQLAVLIGIGQQERVLTAQEAADFLRVSIQHLKDYGPKPFVRYGKSARGDRWRLSDLVR